MAVEAAAVVLGGLAVRREKLARGQCAFAVHLLCATVIIEEKHLPCSMRDLTDFDDSTLSSHRKYRRRPGVNIIGRLIPGLVHDGRWRGTRRVVGRYRPQSRVESPQRTQCRSEGMAKCAPGGARSAKLDLTNDR